MKKEFFLLIGILSTGCSLNEANFNIEENLLLANIASHDFVNTIGKYCIPQNTSVNIQSDSTFASFVEQDLNNAGYSLKERGKKIEIYLDEIEPNLCRTSYKIDKAILSRAYKTLPSGEVKAVGAWSVNGLNIKSKKRYQTAIINASMLYIRKEPNLEAEKIGTLIKGEKIEYININSKWVKLKDKEAFIYSQFLKERR